MAVKLIRTELAEDAEFRARFAREVAAARKVGGVFTAQVIDAEVDGQVPWIVTAYVPGPSLAAAVAKRGAMPAESVAALAAGLAEGLHAIHAADVVHRDLKPSNVLLAQDGPRIIDFGISSGGQATTLTAKGLTIGSPGFMSPEQAEGRKVGAASDVFSLGAVLTYAATGDGPFGDGDSAALLYRVVHGRPNMTGVPDKLVPLLAWCLVKDPDGRPTANEFLAAVTAVYPVSSGLSDWVAPLIGDFPAGYAGKPRAAEPPRPAFVPPQAGQQFPGQQLPGQHFPGQPVPGQPVPAGFAAPPVMTQTMAPKEGETLPPNGWAQQPPAAWPPQGPAGRRPRWPWIAGGAAAAAALVVAVVVTLTSAPAPQPSAKHTRTTATHPASSPSPRPTVGVFTDLQLRTGDCLSGTGLSLNTNNAWPWLLHVVPCSQPHAGEVFYANDHYWGRDQAYPGYTVVDNQMLSECGALFKSYDGIPTSESVYSWKGMAPLDNTVWQDGQRVLVCVAYRPTTQDPGGAPMTGSMKGSRK